MAPNGYKVGIANFPWKGVMSWQTSAWCIKLVLKLMNDDRIREIYTNYHEGNCPIHMLRDIAVKSAMNERCDYLLMIDNDMIPDPKLPKSQPFWKTAWEFTMDRRSREEREKIMPATIASPYFADSAGSFLAYDWNPIPNDEGEDLVLIAKEDALSRRGLGTVVAAQTGLIFYDMRVFWYMPKPWFTYEWKDSEHQIVNLADDFYQTRNLTLAGLPVYMAWDCWSAHLKTSCVTRPPFLKA